MTPKDIMEAINSAEKSISFDTLWEIFTKHPDLLKSAPVQERIKKIAAEKSLLTQNPLDECVMFAIKNKDIAILKLISNNFEIDPNKQVFGFRKTEGNKITPVYASLLDYALCRNSSKAVDFLLKKGANPSSFTLWPKNATDEIDPKGGIAVLKAVFKQYQSSKKQKKNEALNSIQGFVEKFFKNTDVNHFEKLFKPILDSLSSFEEKEFIMGAIKFHHAVLVEQETENPEMTKKYILPLLQKMNAEYSLSQELLKQEKQNKLPLSLQNKIKECIVEGHSKNEIPDKFIHPLLQTIRRIHRNAKDAKTAGDCINLLEFSIKNLPTSDDPNSARSVACECLASCWLNEALKTKDSQKRTAKIYPAIAAYRAAKMYDQSDSLFKMLVWGEEAQAFSVPKKINEEQQLSIVAHNNNVRRALLEMGLTSPEGLKDNSDLNKPNFELPFELRLDDKQLGKLQEIRPSAFQTKELFFKLGNKLSQKKSRKSQLELLETLEKQLNATPNIHNLNILYGALNYLAYELKNEYRFTSNPSRLEWVLLQKKHELENQYRAFQAQPKITEVNNAFQDWANAHLKGNVLKNIANWDKKRMKPTPSSESKFQGEIWSELEKRQEKSKRKRFT